MSIVTIVGRIAAGDPTTALFESSQEADLAAWMKQRLGKAAVEVVVVADVNSTSSGFRLEITTLSSELLLCGR